MKAINNLPEVDISGKHLLITLLSFGIGFAVSEKILVEASGMSEATIKRQRKKLADLGYLQYTPYKRYYVDLKKVR